MFFLLKYSLNCEVEDFLLLVHHVHQLIVLLLALVLQNVFFLVFLAEALLLGDPQLDVHFLFFDVVPDLVDFMNHDGFHPNLSVFLIKIKIRKRKPAACPKVPPARIFSFCLA